jgi:hypothetical protein
VREKEEERERECESDRERARKRESERESASEGEGGREGGREGERARERNRDRKRDRKRERDSARARAKERERESLGAVSRGEVCVVGVCVAPLLLMRAVLQRMLHVAAIQLEHGLSHVLRLEEERPTLLEEHSNRPLHAEASCRALPVSALLLAM